MAKILCAFLVWLALAQTILAVLSPQYFIEHGDILNQDKESSLEIGHNADIDSLLRDTANYRQKLTFINRNTDDHAWQRIQELRSYLEEDPTVYKGRNAKKYYLVTYKYLMRQLGMATNPSFAIKMPTNPLLWAESILTKSKGFQVRELVRFILTNRPIKVVDELDLGKEARWNYNDGILESKQIPTSEHIQAAINDDKYIFKSVEDDD